MRSGIGVAPVCASCPVIVTCRRESEGGRWEQSEEARLLLLRTAIVEGADYVDLEEDIAAKSVAVEVDHEALQLELVGRGRRTK